MAHGLIINRKTIDSNPSWDFTTALLQTFDTMTFNAEPLPIALVMNVYVLAVPRSHLYVIHFHRQRGAPAPLAKRVRSLAQWVTQKEGMPRLLIARGSERIL